MTLYAEVFIRFVSIGMLSGLLVLMMRAGLRTSQMRYAYLLNVCMISMLLVAGTSPWALVGTNWFFLNVFTTLIFPLAWLFGLSLFEEDFSLGRTEITILLIYAVPPTYFGAWLLGFEPPFLDRLRVVWLILSFGMMVHVAYVALAGRSEDLVEARRKERVRAAIAIAFLLVFIFVALETINLFEVEGVWRYLLLLAPPYCLWMLVWMARAHPEALAFDNLVSPIPIEPRLDPRDLPAKARLDSVMLEERVYREQGLTIRKLAEMIDIPEHQLRVIINKSLGFRSFSNFLNHHRIQEAEKRLSDLSDARIPVLTIAMDVGYSSITPFNKAFKLSTGQTPSAYRRAALADLSSE